MKIIPKFLALFVAVSVLALSVSAATYSFNAPIGSVFNRGITSGNLSAAKAVSNVWGFLHGFYTNSSPTDSPYTAAGYVPTSVSAISSVNGGGVSFSTFTKGSEDNILQVTHAQEPALLNNSGPSGENEYLWLTGFPVYDQQTNVRNLALLDAGGAYQITLNRPINESSIFGSVSLLGKNWSIINYTPPFGFANAANIAMHGGMIRLSQSFVPLAVVYLGKNLTSGPFVVQLAGLGNLNGQGTSIAALNIYYKGVLTNSSSVYPGNTVEYMPAPGERLFVRVNQTFDGLYAYQKWAKIEVYTNPITLVDGSTYNQTSDPGWNVNLLWINKTGKGRYTALQSIIVYNSTPTTLFPGESFNFMQNPEAWKVTMLGDTIGNKVDNLSISTAYTAGVEYVNNPGKTGNGLGNIQNITEPGQELILRSQIVGAFAYARRTSNTATYLLTPYTLKEYAHSTSNGTLGNVSLSAPGCGVCANISITNPLIVWVTGYANKTAISKFSVAYVFTSVSGPGSFSTTGVNIYNVSSIMLSRALPGVNVTVGNTTRVLAVLSSTAPVLLFKQNGVSYYGSTSKTAITYNQNNGEATSTFNFENNNASYSAPHNFFTYVINEHPVHGDAGLIDSFAFNIDNSTSGVGATPLFQINYSKFNAPYEMTYKSTQGNLVNAQAGFISERGSRIASIAPTSITLQMAKKFDTMQFTVSQLNQT